MGATLSPHLQTLVRIARAAGDVVMRHYESGAEARIKFDRSPVTDADEEAEKLILAELAGAFAGVPVVAEEEAAAGRITRTGARFFLVDPVDGTKEFIKRGGEFTVNIGEIVDGEPVSGVVLAPAIDRLFVGAVGEGAFELSAGAIRTIAARLPASDGLVAVSSRSHPDAKTDELLKTLPIKGQTNAGSSPGVLPGGGRRGRYLSPRGADHGMGYRRGPCRAAGGRRQGHGLGRRTIRLWQAGLPQRTIYRARQVALPIHVVAAGVENQRHQARAQADGDHHAQAEKEPAQAA